MPKFTVFAVVSTTLFKEVEAESEEAAKLAAEELSIPHLCHYCSGAGKGQRDVWQISDGLGEDVAILSDAT